jgi:hypothetical protein
MVRDCNPAHQLYPYHFSRLIAMGRTELIICSVLFIVAMVFFKYVVAPGIVGNFGIVGALVFIGVCILIAYRIDGKKRH